VMRAATGSLPSFLLARLVCASCASWVLTAKSYDGKTL
jgi:hypothetical protein